MLGVFAAGAQACGPDALGVSRTISVSAAGGLAVGLKSYPRTLRLADHEVVLTFDDGPLPATTPKVLAALEKECVKATFFLIGRAAEAAPALAAREIALGHSVGHHTFSHPSLTLTYLPDAEARADIDRGFAADDKAAYGAAGAQPKVGFFRFPGFGDTPALLDWLAARKVAVFGADLWASDWLPMTPDAERRLLLSRLDKAGRGIILMHDTKAQTAAMLPAFLRDLKARGYHVVHLTPGAGPTAVDAAPEGWSSETASTIAHMWPRPAPGAGPAPSPSR